MSGDETKVWIVDPSKGVVNGEPEKIHPSPAVVVDEFQAVSVLQMTGSSVCRSSFDWPIGC